jgi:hypothetical protein
MPKEKTARGGKREGQKPFAPKSSTGEKRRQIAVRISPELWCRLEAYRAYESDVFSLTETAENALSEYLQTRGF